MRTAWALRSGAILVALLAVGAALLHVHAEGFFLPVLAWIKSLGAWGPAAMILLYVVACLLFLPGWILSVGSGFIFGLAAGIPTVSLGATLGAMAAFAVGRTLGRDRLAKQLSGNATFAAINEAVGRGGFKLVLLLRLSPLLPFNLLNYALGLTPVSFGQYALASWLGMLPGIVLYIYIGSAARSLTEITRPASGGEAQTIFFWTGLAATVIAAAWGTRLARRHLRLVRPNKEDQTRA